MSKVDFSDYIHSKVKEYTPNQVIFTKKNVSFLLERINSSEEDVKKDIFLQKHLTFTEKQSILFDSSSETRYRCYFIYSNSRGRCYVLTFNSVIKIITAFPLGRKTLNRYRKRFK